MPVASTEAFVDVHALLFFWWKSIEASMEAIEASVEGMEASVEAMEARVEAMEASVDAHGSCFHGSFPLELLPRKLPWNLPLLPRK